MNERITKIVIETLGKEGVIDSRAFGHWALSDEQLEKFAELIVRECMACSTWVGKVNKNAIEPIHTAHAINQRIKKHFGVEE